MLAPQKVTGLTSGVTQVSAGGFHTCAVVEGGAFCWGERADGRLGEGSLEAGDVTTPTEVMGLTSGVTQVSAGGEHTCAVVNGGAMCWGEGGSGRLGHNEAANANADKPSPTQVHGLAAGVTQISAGGEHTCAVVNGGAWCWGEGGAGQLGHNEGNGTADKPSPTQVAGLTSGVTQISAGGEHTCAVMNGAALCWGEGGAGRLGNSGFETDRSRPMQVTGLTRGVTQISAGGEHTCALVNGIHNCWGRGRVRNRPGQFEGEVQWEEDNE